MKKYKEQLNRKFEAKESIVDVSYHDRTVCLSFEGLTTREAGLLGDELVNRSVCRDTVAEWNGVACLWLEEFDYGMYGDGEEFISLLEETGKECGFDLTIYNPAPT